MKIGPLKINRQGKAGSDRDISALVEAIPASPSVMNLTNLSNEVAIGDISFHFDDITTNWKKNRYEAIIVPEYPDRVCDIGVAGAIMMKKKKAHEAMMAYDAYAKANGPLDYGTVVITSVGNGINVMLVHVVSIGAGKKHDFETAKTCISNAYNVLQDNDLPHWIAIPAINTGHTGTLTYEQSAKAIFGGIEDYRKRHDDKSTYTGIFMYSSTANAAFKKVYKEKSYHFADETQPGERDPAFAENLLIGKPKDPRINSILRTNKTNGIDPA